MSKYYLVAKSKTSDKFEIVKIKGNEIYREESDMLERCFNLERIDLFTSRFKTEERLKEYLKANGRVNLDDYDLFIVSRNGQKTKFLNCLYNFGSRVELLRHIMIDSDQNKLTANSKTVSSLLDDFIKDTKAKVEPYAKDAADRVRPLVHEGSKRIAKVFTKIADKTQKKND